MALEKKDIIVIGSGVIGLSLSYLLLKSNKFNVTIISEHIPPTDSVEFTSAKAGAIWRSYGDEFNQEHKDYDKITWNYLLELSEEYTELKSIIKLARVSEGWESINHYQSPWFKHFVPNFKFLENDELPKGIVKGIEYDTLCINTPGYLLWLKDQFINLGGKFIQKRLSKLEDVFDLSLNINPDLIVNCSGIGFTKFNNFKEDTDDLIPVRGQTLLVDAPQLTRNMFIYPKNRPGQEFYVILRGNGDVILGGVRQPGNWSTDYDFTVEKMIIDGCIKYHPELTKDNFKIKTRNVGFRPGRKSGIRIESDSLIDKNGKKLPIVHFYGHGGAGYQSSWGSSIKAFNLVDTKLNVSNKL